MSTNSKEELEHAIENCKEIILQTNNQSDKKRQMIKELIELRRQLHELKVIKLSVRTRFELIYRPEIELFFV